MSDWIPCVERLPEPGQKILFQIGETKRFGEIWAGRFLQFKDEEDLWCTNGIWNWETREVLACQPLPGPYRPEVKP